MPAGDHRDRDISAAGQPERPSHPSAGDDRHPHGSDTAVRRANIVVVAVVAAVAAYVSYRHAYELVLTHGEDRATAALLPLTTDGLIFAGSGTALIWARRGEAAPRLARWTLALGIGASISANVAHGVEHGLVGAVIAGWPALALVLVYENLMMIIKDARRVSHPGYAVSGLGMSVSAVSRSTDTQESVLPDCDADTQAAMDSLLASAGALFADELAQGRRPSIRAIRAAMNIGQPKAQHVQAYLASLPATQDPEADGQSLPREP